MAFTLELVSVAEFASIKVPLVIDALLSEYQPKVQVSVDGVPLIAKSPLVTSSSPKISA